MKIQNIIKSISAVIGLLAALFLIRIILAGDEDIKMAASMGEYGKVTALVEIARIVLFLSIAITLIFSLRGLFSDIKKLKKAGILSVGVACSKLSGGTYVMWNNHDILCVESPSSHDILFSGKRVTANLKSGEQLPEDFGQGSSLEALVDIIFSSRLEIKDGVTKIARVLLKKPKIKSIADSPSETIDESIEKTLSETSKAV